MRRRGALYRIVSFTGVCFCAPCRRTDAPRLCILARSAVPSAEMESRQTPFVESVRENQSSCLLDSVQCFVNTCWHSGSWMPCWSICRLGGARMVCNGHSLAQPPVGMGSRSSNEGHVLQGGKRWCATIWRRKFFCVCVVVRRRDGALHCGCRGSTHADGCGRRLVWAPGGFSGREGTNIRLVRAVLRMAFECSMRHDSRAR